MNRVAGRIMAEGRALFCVFPHTHRQEALSG
jgi:hypothetical protein